MTVDKFQLLFFGSDLFSVRVLQHLLDKRLCPIKVVTKPHTVLDRFSAGRQLERYAWHVGLTNVHDTNPFSIGLVASFGNLIDEVTVNRFKYGLFNVHPSLLPQYRGSTPVQAAVFDNLRETGCTIMRIPPVAKFDIGDIILQERLAIKEREYAVELRDRLADLGARLAERFLLNYESCLQQSRPQGTENKSLARKLKPDQGHLKFRSETLDLIDRKVRAYTGFIEIFITCLNGLAVKLEGMREPLEVNRQYDLDTLVRSLLLVSNLMQDGDKNGVIKHGDIEQLPAGIIYFHKIRRLLCIKTVDEKWLAFEWATPEGKPKMSALDFFNGYLSKVPQQDRITDV